MTTTDRYEAARQWDPRQPGEMLERRTTIIIEGKPLVCGQEGDPLAFPTAYIEAAIAEAQAALRGVSGARGALLTLTIKVEPFAESPVERL
jgi:hypothetical protein